MENLKTQLAIKVSTPQEVYDYLYFLINSQGYTVNDLKDAGYGSYLN